MNKIRSIVLIELLLILAVGCRETTISDSNLLPLELPSSDLNREIILVLLDELNTYKINDSIALDAFNTTTRSIQVVDDEGILIFLQTSDGWVKISNLHSYSGRISIIPTRSQDPLGAGSFMYTLLPDLTSYIGVDPIKIRIYLVGSMCDQAGLPTEEMVGAFLDLELIP